MGGGAAKGLNFAHLKKGKWPLVRGKYQLWDLKTVAAGRVREVAVGEG